MMPYRCLILLLSVFLYAFEVGNAQAENIRIKKSVDYSSKLTSKSGGDPIYKMTIGFTDLNGDFHQLPQTFIAEENELVYRPCLYFDGKNYYIFVKSLDNNSFNGYIFRYHPQNGFVRETVFENASMGYAPFFGKLSKGEPTLYFIDRTATIGLIKAEQNNGSWSFTPAGLSFEDYISLYNYIPQVQSHENSYKQYPFKLNKVASSTYRAIWCKGDDLRYAKQKPNVIYEEVAGSKYEIPNMPRVEKQSELGECEAYAFGVLWQKMTCDKWKSDIPDCSNPPADSRISYWGMLRLIHRDVNGKFILSYDDEMISKKQISGGYNSALRLAWNPARFNGVKKIILDDEKPFQNISMALSHTNGAKLSDSEVIQKTKRFLRFLNNFYATRQQKPMATSKALDSLLFYTGMDAKYFDLDKALAQPTYEDFTESLFFEGCKGETFPTAPLLVYPIDINGGEITLSDLKNKIVDIIKTRNRPVIFIHALKVNIDGTMDMEKSSHYTVVCGYKQVKNPTNGNLLDAFKIHNSWGTEWQQENNNGWIDADNFIDHAVRYWSDTQKKLVIESASVIFLDY